MAEGTATAYPCPECGQPVEYTHGAIGRPPWCFCRACGTMFNPEHTDTPPLTPAAKLRQAAQTTVDEDDAQRLLAQAEALAPIQPVQEDTVTEPAAETPAAEAKAPREVKHRPDPNTPFTEDDLAKLPNWAQGKVRYLNAQLVRVLEQLASTPTPAAAERFLEPVTGEARPAEGDTPPLGLTVSEDGDLLNWQGENYVRQGELVAVRYTAAARLARLAELVSEGLEELPELEGYDDADE